MPESEAGLVGIEVASKEFSRLFIIAQKNGSWYCGCAVLLSLPWSSSGQAPDTGEVALLSLESITTTDSSSC